MATNEERHAETHRRILAAATDLFTHNGFTKTSITAIAKQAGVSPVTLYKYFDSKMTLGHQVMRHIVVEGYGRFQKLVDDTSIDFTTLVRKMIQSKHDFVKDMNSDFYKFALKDLQGEFDSTEVMQANQDCKARFWGTLIRRGREAGLIRPQISDQALMVYIDMYMQYAQNPKNGTLPAEHPVAMKILTDELVYLFFYGFIGCEPGDQSGQ
ncbi:TetR/AcrR family transcriptional regulator [Sporolactobacillus sp. Y61]|uniref:TetR/AcrR family transcriptional regulator n=1 Tax=Sporolactobacillus sp. Y61 TaxID=3160863 RepID=A0AAU8IGT4_9BACL